MEFESCLVFLFLLFSLIMPLAATAQVSDPDVLYEQNAVVIIGCDRDYPPMSYMKNYKPAGFDIEIINRLAHSGKFEAEIQATEWTLVLSSLLNGQIDAASGMIRTAERTKLFDFSIPYLSESYAVFTHADSKLSSIHDLKGRRIAILENDAIIETFITPYDLDDNMILTSSFFTALQLVSSGDADYTIAPYSMGLKARDALNLNELKPSERSLLTVEYRFAVRKGRSELLFKLNDALRELYEAGTLDTLYDESDFSRQFFLSSNNVHSQSFLGFVLIVAAVFIVIMFQKFIQRRMQIQVAKIESQKMIFESVIDSLPVMISWKSSDLEVQGCNSRCRASDGSSLQARVSESAVLRRGKSTVEYISSSLSGDYECRRITCLPLIDGNDKVCGVLGLGEDYTEQRRLSSLVEKISGQLILKVAELEQLRLTDLNTGLFNHWYLRSKISEENELYSVYGQKFCVMLIEAEYYQPVNAELGKIEESNIILYTADLLKMNLRQSDIAGRLDCGKFVIILPKTSLEEAGKVTENFLNNIESGTKNIRFHCGVFELPSEKPDELPAEVRELLNNKRDLS